MRSEATAAVEAIDGADRALLLPLAQLVLVLPPAGEEEVAAVLIQWAEGAPLEIPPPGSTLWRAALTMRLNQLRGGDELAEIECGLLQFSLERFPSLRVWWSWLQHGWLEPGRYTRNGTR